MVVCVKWIPPYNNYAAAFGSAIGSSYFYSATPSANSYLYVQNCTIVSNSGAISYRLYNSSLGYHPALYLQNSIVYSNGTPFALADTTYPNPVTNTFTNSCFYPTNTCSWSGSGIITNYPQFVNFAGLDFHLQSKSPCINTGTNQDWWMIGATDLDGQRRIDPVSGIVDMGCYEYVTRGTMFIIR